MVEQHQTLPFPESVEIDAKGWVFDQSTGEILGDRSALYAWAASQPEPAVRRIGTDEPEPEAGSALASTRYGLTLPHPPIPAEKPQKTANSTEVRDRQRRKLRSGHRRLIEDLHKPLGLCGVALPTSQQIAAGGADDSMAHVRVVVGKEGAKPFLGNVSHCDNAWACPVCAPRLAARRCLALKPQIEARQDAGARNYLITLTLRHEHKDDLGWLHGGLQKIWSRVTSGRAWKDVKGRIEWVKGHDTTHGRHGWHPHLHLFVSIAPDESGGNDDTDAIARMIADRWRQMAEKCGFEAIQDAQDVQECRDPAEAAAYATTPAGVMEVAGLATKRGNKGGQTPFEILSEAVAGDESARLLWRDYVGATKGRRQIATSKGFDLTEETMDEAETEDAERQRDEDDDEPSEVYELAQMDGRALWYADQDRDRGIEDLFDRLRGQKLADLPGIVKAWADARPERFRGSIQVERSPKPV